MDDLKGLKGYTELTALFMEAGAAYDRMYDAVKPEDGGGWVGGDVIPCNGPFKSNCRPSAPVNPPSRGCESVEQCQGWWSYC
ncbi:hypothetical protein QJS10_CPB14g01651 [Acorus calamus]|uniref:Uncharacterized protein n=1 Tax=Acorus calamus TaxID=4465 RepID=A0AAV9DB92_ACOCL|nr:hypothetical protein QJS10_CPB14g01651 [Acorus calamus]